MIIVLRSTATQADIDQVVERITQHGLKPHVSRGVERTIIGAMGDERVLRNVPFEALPAVEKVLPILTPFKLASRDFKAEPSVVEVNGVAIGGERLAVIAGPCSVEGREMLLDTATKIKKAGATLLRGGAFKPRTSPYSFQGLGEEGLRYLAEVREVTGLPVVSELMDPRDAELVMKYADMVQIGARNMQNFRLLKEVGIHRKPVLLKRGIRTFEEYTRNTLDLSAVPSLKQLSHLPVIVDPSHAAGKWDLVAPLTLAAVAVGADGVMVEVHPQPEVALSDGPQALIPGRFAALMEQMRALAPIVGRTL